MSKKKGNIGVEAVEARKLLHDDLVVALDAVEVPGSKPGSKLYLIKFRQVAKEHLDKAGPNYLPLDLNRLTPKTFLNYLLSLSDVKNNEYMKSYGGHRSSLTQLYTQCEIAPTKIFLQKMKQVMSGLKNTSATSRGHRGVRLSEGKEPLPLEMYCSLRKWRQEDGSNESIFGHCFLALTSNLMMCRSKNTVLVQRDHIDWFGDAMTIQFSHSKTDREGQDAGNKRHVYANPFMPAICPVLSIARYFAANPDKERESTWILKFLTRSISHATNKDPLMSDWSVARRSDRKYAGLIASPIMSHCLLKHCV